MDWSPKDVWEKLHQFSCDPENFWPQIRQRIERVPQVFARIAKSGALQWIDKIRFVTDVPGKNTSKGMSGGGITTDTLMERLWREIRPFRIYDGPSEVHRWAIAKRVASRALKARA